MNPKPFIQEFGDKDSSITIVCIHGWGQTHAFWQPLDTLPYRILALDLPGFGQTPHPENVWGIEEYAKWLEQILLEQNIESPIVIGHSFGSRIAIIYTKQNPQTSCVLIGPSGTPHTIWKARFVTALAWISPWLLYRTTSWIRSHTWYQNTHIISGKGYQIMYEIFAKTHLEPNQIDVQTSLTNHELPTTVIVGKDDKITPPSRVKKLSDSIPFSSYYELPGDHFVLWQYPDKTIDIIERHIVQHTSS